MATVTAAQGSQSKLVHKKQTVLGTAATGDYTTLRYNTHGLKAVKGAVESQEIRGDRQVAEYRHGNRAVSGPIVTELCWGAHETLFESLGFNVFDTNSYLYIPGVTRQYLSIEDQATDIAQYRLFQDMMVNSLQLSIRPEAMVMATWQLAGLSGGTPSGSTLGGTPVAAANTRPFDSFTAALYDNEAGTGTELAVISSLDLNIANDVGPKHVVGQQTGALLESGNGVISGKLTALFQDSTWLDRFLNETEFGMYVTITDPDGNDYGFRMPRVKLSDADVPVTDMKSRIITAPFRALYSVNSLFALRVEKT